MTKDSPTTQELRAVAEAADQHADELARDGASDRELFRADYAARQAWNEVHHASELERIARALGRTKPEALVGELCEMLERRMRRKRDLELKLMSLSGPNLEYKLTRVVIEERHASALKRLRRVVEFGASPAAELRRILEQQLGYIHNLEQAIDEMQFKRAIASLDDALVA